MRWKSAQKKAKLNRKIHLAVITLMLILAVVIVGHTIRIGRNLFSPLSASERVYHWDGTFNLNLVLLTKPLSVLSYNPIDQKASILEVPDETYLTVPGGFGSWRAGAIYKLGGTTLLKSSMQNFLSLPIDGYIQFNSNKSPKELVDLFRQNPWTTLTALPNLKTDLTPVELTHFLLGIRGVRFDKITEFNLQYLGLLQPDTLADGTPVLLGDPVKIDSLISKNFADTKVLGESASIAILNSTDKFGLAGKTAELVSHLGGNVIIQTSLDDKIAGNKVSGDENFPYTMKRLKQIFTSNCHKNCDIISTDSASLTRASVNLILGSQ